MNDVTQGKEKKYSAKGQRGSHRFRLNSGGRSVVRRDSSSTKGKRGTGQKSS